MRSREGWEGGDGSSITIDIIIIILTQLAKLLQNMQAEHHQRLQDDHTQPSDNSPMHAHSSLAQNFKEKVQQKDQVKIVKIQNEGDFPFQAFQVSAKSISSPDQIVDGTCKKPSIFHNFQKHLITTLKTHITFRPGRSNEISDQLMVSLWNYFMKSNKPTKKYLYSLLMTLPHSLVEFHQKTTDQHTCDQFQRVLQGASQEQIKQAQSKLRYQLMRQSKRLLEDGELNHRRMRRLDEFKQYFGTFIEDLESGELNLRLPKKNKATAGSIKMTETVLIMKKESEQ